MSQVSSIGFLGRVCEGYNFLGGCTSKPSYTLASVVQLFHDRQSCLAGINNCLLDDQERRLRAIPLVLKVGASATLIVAGAVSTCYAVKNFFSKSNGTTTRFNTLYRGAQLGQVAFHLLDLIVNHDLYRKDDRIRGVYLLLCMSVHVIATHIIQNESTHLSAYNTSNGLATRPKVPGIAYFGLRQVIPLESRFYRMSASWVQAIFNLFWCADLITNPPRRYARSLITARHTALQTFLQVKRQIGPYQRAIATCDVGFLPPEAADQGKLYDFPHQKRLLAHVKSWTEAHWAWIYRGYLSFDRFMQSRRTQQLVTLANTEAVYSNKIEKTLSTNTRLQPLCGAISLDLPICAVLDPTNNQTIYDLKVIQK